MESPFSFLFLIDGEWMGEVKNPNLHDSLISELNAFQQAIEKILAKIPKAEWGPVPHKSGMLIAISNNRELSLKNTYSHLILPEYNTLTTRSISNGKTRRIDDASIVPLPMLMIGTDDIMEVENLEAQTATEQEANEIEIKESFSLRDKIRYSLDTRYRFWDSSIWQRYVSLVPLETFEMRLVGVVRDLLSHYKSGLYTTIVGREYLEFQCRKLQNSYYLHVNEGHSRQVTPYRFHSETKMQSEAQECKGNLTHQSWNCLIIDDFFKKPLRHVSSDRIPQNPDSYSTDSPQKRITKTALIKGLLLSGDERDWIRFLNEGDRDPGKYYLAEGAKKWIEDYPQADIILLDYFLGRDEKRVKERYGHFWVQELIKSKNPNPNKPFDKFWIFPISVFDYSFESHMRLKGLSKINDRLVMADGADPINTPELFKKLLFTFLETYRQEVGCNPEKLINAYEEYPLMELNSKFQSLYPKIVDYQVRLNRLLLAKNKKENDKDLSNALAKSILESVDPKDWIQPRFCLLLQDMSYQIAYGGGLDWPKMWENYIQLQQLYTQVVFASKSSKEQESLSKTERALGKILEDIRSYIIQLKQNKSPSQSYAS